MGAKRNKKVRRKENSNNRSKKMKQDENNNDKSSKNSKELKIY